MVDVNQDPITMSMLSTLSKIEVDLPHNCLVNMLNGIILLFASEHVAYEFQKGIASFPFDAEVEHISQAEALKRIRHYFNIRYPDMGMNLTFQHYLNNLARRQKSAKRKSAIRNSKIRLGLTGLGSLVAELQGIKGSDDALVMLHPSILEESLYVEAIKYAVTNEFSRESKANDFPPEIDEGHRDVFFELSEMMGGRFSPIEIAIKAVEALRGGFLGLSKEPGSILVTDEPVTDEGFIVIYVNFYTIDNTLYDTGLYFTDSKPNGLICYTLEDLNAL
ncbi:MAG: hypothetical protein ABIE74_01215 [Pseudomonadota bacterium]